MSNNIRTPALIGEWKRLQQTASVECGADRVLETKINYLDFRKFSHIVVSDLISAGRTGTQEGQQSGVGQMLVGRVRSENVLDLCYANGSFDDLEAKLSSVTELMDTNKTTIHIFVSMLSSPGCPIEHHAVNLEMWSRIARCLRNFKSRPYLVFNAHVIGNYEDAVRQNGYREFLGRIVTTIEEYCLIDQSAQFWDSLFRLVDGDEQT
jgi:hypothetical protein